ncbi:MAG TPA: hypothetical protein DCL75_06465 [Ktedonobacter sp.]|nr:hypothetical protein [Ktedonobacter sp.]HAG98495.1 hypothetical protein [Ktedonobacter sp.]
MSQVSITKVNRFIHMFDTSPIQKGRTIGFLTSKRRGQWYSSSLGRNDGKGGNVSKWSGSLYFRNGKMRGDTMWQKQRNFMGKKGYRILSLATGAANEQALGFYRHMGYLDEDVTLVKLL